MFNDKTNQKKNKAAIVLTGAAILAMSATFGYSAIANDQIQAFVSKPALRTEYKSADMIDLAGAIDLKNGNQKLSVSLRESDLKAALRMMADKAGLNIIFHQSVGGTVTLDLIDVTLNDAFKMLLQACDLSFVIDNGTLIVMSKTASLSSDISKQKMMTIPVKYADATKIADFLNTNIFSTNRPGLSNNKIVVTNAATNELVLFGTVNDYNMAQKVVSKLDTSPKTVSYRINHTTPQEMATLICDSLFPSSGESSGDSSGSFGGFGSMTGGASSLGSSDDSSSSSDSLGSSSDSSSSGGTITLGEGKVACSIKGDVAAGSLKSLTGTSLTVTYFPQKGTINITGGSEQQAEMIKQFIVANDKKQPQAYVEVQVIDLSEEGSKEFNNSWDIMTPFFAANFGGENGLATKNPLFITGNSLVNGDSTVTRYHGKKTLAWTINYLIKNEKARLLANPKVVVTNGKTSTINLTEDYVKKVEEEILTAGLGTTGSGTSRTYEIGEDKGIIIQLTPFISPDGYVTMNLKPSYSTLAGEEMSVSSTGIPIRAATLLKRRSLDLSNIRVKDGETLVIGGMIQEEEKKTVSKFPLLGDLPVVGSVFRNTKTENVKSELVIMVTPRIIKDTEDAIAQSENL